MGQIFYASAYDIKEKTCCVMDADKFHANCYSYSGAVLSIHYLLRQKPYHVMWGGRYVRLGEDILAFSAREDLYGLSTYLEFKGCGEDREKHSKKYRHAVKRITQYGKQWRRIRVLNEAIAYFDWDATQSVQYSGFLLNRTQKCAVDLADYYAQSRYIEQDDTDAAIDLVPVLTETGGGTQMALFDGVALDSTEDLAQTWCGDLLQIVESLPNGYAVINCCFADVKNRLEYCYKTFGANEAAQVLADKSGRVYEGAALTLRGKRGPPSFFKVEVQDDEVYFVPSDSDASST
ncbi:hypothetical protein FACS1894200_00700 [Spirochaetia bacterium]|nr:hypothetical protein FACS1894200_00700 [Spirochaetia bacterium]